MDSNRFDALTRNLARRLSRRRAAASGIGLLGAAAFRNGAAQNATPGAEDAMPGGGNEDPTFLFVQTASAGTFHPNPSAGTPSAGGPPVPGGDAQYLLTLENHSGGTIYFTDRPERVAGEVPTGAFLDGLGFSPDNPPNAVLVVQTELGDDIAVLELVEPVYDEESGTVTYGANVLVDYRSDGLAHLAAQQQDEALPAEFGRASLFIDDCADQVWGCFPRTGVEIDAPVGYVTLGRCWEWLPPGCSWSNCEDQLDPDSRCNQSGYDCGEEGCIACTTSPTAVALGEGGECL